MKVKQIEKYSKKELLQLILGSQVYLTKRINEINLFLCNKYGDEIKNESNLDESLNEIIEHLNELDRQIKSSKI